MTTPLKPPSTTNLRQLFRVPVLPSAGLLTTVDFDGRAAVKVNVCDVTELGIQIKLSAKNSPSFIEGARVDVDFLFRGETIHMNGEVSRLTDDHVVILLPDPTTNVQRREASRWHDVKLSLQQLWLKTRVK